MPCSAQIPTISAVRKVLTNLFEQRGEPRANRFYTILLCRFNVKLHHLTILRRIGATYKTSLTRVPGAFEYVAGNSYKLTALKDQPLRRRRFRGTVANTIFSRHTSRKVKYFIVRTVSLTVIRSRILGIAKLDGEYHVFSQIVSYVPNYKR